MNAFKIFDIWCIRPFISRNILYQYIDDQVLHDAIAVVVEPPPGIVESGNRDHRPPVASRSYFPETWLWAHNVVGLVLSYYFVRRFVL